MSYEFYHHVDDVGEDPATILAKSSDIAHYELPISRLSSYGDNELGTLYFFKNLKAVSQFKANAKEMGFMDLDEYQKTFSISTLPFLLREEGLDALEYVAKYKKDKDMCFYVKELRYKFSLVNKVMQNLDLEENALAVILESDLDDIISWKRMEKIPDNFKVSILKYLSEASKGDLFVQYLLNRTVRNKEM